MLGDVHRRRRTAVTATIWLALVAPSASAAAPASVTGGVTAQPVAGNVAAPPVARAAGSGAVLGSDRAAGCRGAGARPGARSPRALARALLCVVDRRRAAHRLGPLTADRRMGRAARRHARDMVRRGYFAHQRAGGPNLTARLGRAGWHGSAWGEAIARGCGPTGTPRATARAWMASPPHRAIVLNSGYRRAGAAMAASGGCATWVLDAGRL